MLSLWLPICTPNTSPLADSVAATAEGMVTVMGWPAGAHRPVLSHFVPPLGGMGPVKLPAYVAFNCECARQHLSFVVQHLHQLTDAYVIFGHKYHAQHRQHSQATMDVEQYSMMQCLDQGDGAGCFCNYAALVSMLGQDVRCP